MTLQERELLTRFLQLLASARAGQKDAEAEALIREVVARQPDAAYLLVQRALQLEQLLQSSQEQIRSLQAELDQARAGSSSSGSFLNDPNAWGSRPSAPQPPAQESVSGQPLQPLPQQSVSGQPPAQQGVAQQTLAARAAPGSSWASGLFGNIASTAAGVVAGSFLFQGIQGLMHRGEPHPLASGTDLNSPWPAETPLDTVQQDQPELLNSYFSDDSDGDSSLLADQDDSSDFV